MNFADGKVVYFSQSGSGWHSDSDVFEQLVELVDDNQATTGWTLTRPDNSIEQYDSSGKLVSIKDINGNIQTLSYNGANGLLERVDSDAGDYLSFAYDTENRIASVSYGGGSSRTWSYRYDANGNLEYVDNPDGTTRQYHYEDANFPNVLTGITDERGVRYATYAYDAQGRTILSTHAGNAQRIDITYNDADDTRTVTNSLGEKSTYSTTVQLGLTMITDVAGPGCSTCSTGNTSYNYDPATNNLLSKTENGITTKYAQYDNKGQYGCKVEGITAADTSAGECDFDPAASPDARRTDYTYDSRFFHKITSITEPSVLPGASKFITYTYDIWGNRTSETVTGFDPSGNPVSRTTRWQYGGDGTPECDAVPLHRLCRRDGPRIDVADITIYRYYPNDTSVPVGSRARLKEIEDATGILIRRNIQYTATGKVASESRPNGLTLTYTYYPGNDRLQTLTETGPTGTRVTRWTYLATGEVQSITTADGTPDAATLSFSYDDARRLTRITDGLGNYIDYTLDTEGNRTFEKTYDSDGALKKQLSQAFDIYNRLDTTTHGTTPLETTDPNFAPDGTLDTQTDGLGTVTDYSYDALKRLTRVVQNLGGTDPATADTATAYGYDVADRLTTVTDPNNGTTTYTYDDLGNLVSQTSPDTGATTFQYDAAGNLIRKSDAKGQVFTYRYDALNRLTALDAPGTTDDITYAYDTCTGGVGRLCRVTYGSGTLPGGNRVHYRYDAFGDITQHQGILAGYDAQGRVQTLDYPSGSRLTYRYDAAGQVSQMDFTVNGQPQALAANLGYAPFGALTGLTYGNGLVLSQTLDSAYRLTAQRVVDNPATPTVTVLDRTYPAYDANGNRLSQTDTLAGPATYTYDSLNRLDTAAGRFGTRDYDYDPNGNRIQQTDDGTPTVLTYAPNSNRLSTLGAADVLLDAVGNTLNQGSWTYSYTPHHRLATATESATLKASFTYNGLGQRTGKTDEVTATGKHFLYGTNGELLAETDENGNVLSEYLYLNGQLLAIFSPDDDQDGIPNQAEARLGTLPQNPDSDGDGLTNLAEWYQSGTDSQNPDSDGDGILDGAEVTAGTSPNDATTFPGDGDINENGETNLGDLVLLYQMVMGSRTPTSTQFTHADMNRDGKLNAADILLLQKLLLQAWLGLPNTFMAADFDRGQPPATSGSSSLIAGWLNKLIPAARAVPANGGVLYYVHNDPLGTPQALTDESGTVVWKADYDPFGKATVDDDPDGDGNTVEFNVRFAGQYFDKETGLHYNLMRDYSPETGRYLEADPIGQRGGINIFLYAENNPIRNIDPLGLCPGCFAGATGTGGALGGFGGTGGIGGSSSSTGSNKAPVTFNQLMKELGMQSGAFDGDGPFELPPDFKPIDRDQLTETIEQPNCPPPQGPDPGNGCRKAIENILARCAKISNKTLRRACLLSAIPLMIICQ